jgi:hypothetical protein
VAEIFFSKQILHLHLPLHNSAVHIEFYTVCGNKSQMHGLFFGKRFFECFYTVAQFGFLLIVNDISSNATPRQCSIICAVILSVIKDGFELFGSTYLSQNRQKLSESAKYSILFSADSQIFLMNRQDMIVV